jgi:DNA ligase-1
LYTRLLDTTRTDARATALADYFRAAPPADAAWALFLLSGRKLGPIARAPQLRAWAAEIAGVPGWLLDESHAVSGDLAETLALVLPDHKLNDKETGRQGERETSPPHALSPGLPVSSSEEQPLSTWLEDRLLPLRDRDESALRAGVVAGWRELDAAGRLVWNRLLMGGLRAMSQPLLVRALADASGVDPAAIAHRLANDWSPTPEFYTELLGGDTHDADLSRPYPFCLAQPLPGDPEALGEIAAWRVEWLWEGARAQLIRRAGQTFLWARAVGDGNDAETLVGGQFPALVEQGDQLPEGTAIDGVIRAGPEGAPELVALDLLEAGSRDVRVLPLEQRIARLQEVVASGMVPAADQPERQLPLWVAPPLEASAWDDVAALWSQARAHGAGGLVMKRRDAPYQAGRQSGDWWAWPVAPFTINAVLIYAQRGIGRYASMYSEYTFGVWGDTQAEGAPGLVPIAKTSAGLPEPEIRRIDVFVRRNVIEKFGPVRTVRPELVFELAFEGIEQSARHKSGLVVRRPRILRRRPDMPADQAATLDMVRRLL